MQPSNAHGLGDIGRLRKLVDLSVTLNSTLEPDKLLRGILKTATELLNCETASILLFNEKRGDLSFMTATGDDFERLKDISVPLEGSIAGTIFKTGETLVINDVANDPRHFAGVSKQTQYQPRSLAGVPMRLRDRSTGVLEALNKRVGGFSPADAEVLAVIAAQAAVAVHNAQLVQDLKRAHAEVSRVDKIKSRFMALASHELRTPLAVITSYAEFLHRDTEGTKSRHAARVLQAALQQRTIIDAMTNMNLLQLGAFDLRLERLALSAVVQGVVDEMWDAAHIKHQSLELKLPDASISIQGDAARLPLVFKNVIDNAIRFTPTDGVIRVELHASPGEARVIVNDTGAGIPAGELTNIFKDYYQVEDHMTRRHGGLGLGLSIARGILNLHGGRIWAESAGPNHGTTITMVLPRSN